ncbi:MAG: SH3 domain-containing protein [Clostridia bacterium]|nr:SH3 domain-containing protein [Clostridia bacterium]
MKKRLSLLLCLALALATLMSAASASAAAYSYDYDDYSGLIGAMEIVNCKSYAVLRAYPNTSSQQVARVPLGEVVTNCWYEDDRFTYCEYGGVGGYILNSNLSFISGPIGQEYYDDEYLGNMMIVNCKSYATLRAMPDTRAQQVARVPLGAIVTNVFYEDDRFCYCMYGNLEGFVLTENLAWVSGGRGADYIGDAMIVNCKSYATLRSQPSTSSLSLGRVPLGAVVTDCYIVDERFACCTYNGVVGYILLENLYW